MAAHAEVGQRRGLLAVDDARVRADGDPGASASTVRTLGAIQRRPRYTGRFHHGELQEVRRIVDTSTDRSGSEASVAGVMAVCARGSVGVLVELVRHRGPMPFDIEIEHHADYLRFAWSGEPTRDDVVAAWRRVFDESMRTGRQNLLVEIEYRGTLAAYDAYAAMEEIVRDARVQSMSMRIARVFPSDAVRTAHDFSENVAVNRGLVVKTFYGDVRAALAWLLQAES